jgi:hypothetical protein
LPYVSRSFFDDTEVQATGVLSCIGRDAGYATKVRDGGRFGAQQQGESCRTVQEANVLRQLETIVVRQEVRVHSAFPWMDLKE